MINTKNNIPNNSELTPVISLKGVNKWYGDFQALSNIDLEIKLKEKIVICGPSGSGKSTVALTDWKPIKRAQFMLAV